MSLKYVFKIQAGLKKYKFIPTKLPASSILDGAYMSIHKGRSLNFDELREYVPGDEIKDIDWKATARTRNLLVRSYIAEKKHSFLFILDTNKRMLGQTRLGEEKREVALYGAGTFSCLISMNGDYIGCMYADEKGKLTNNPAKTGLYNIERFLEQYHSMVSRENESQATDALTYVASHIKKRTMIVLVTDMEGFCKIPESLIRKVQMQHEMLVLLVSDANMFGKNVYNVETGDYLPSFFSESKSLRKKEEARMQELYDQSQKVFDRNRIAHTMIDSADNMDTKIIELLEKKKAINANNY